MLTYIGIDPGVGGAVAVAQRMDDNKWSRRVFSTPRADESDPKNRGFDIPGMVKLIRQIREGHETYACMEQVNSRPGEGHAGAFSFGFGWGLWRGVLAGCDIECALVDPRKWKNTYPLPYRADYNQRKEDARQLATKLFPDCKGSLTRKMDHDRAEALLICDWFRKKHVWLREMNKPFLWDAETGAIL